MRFRATCISMLPRWGFSESGSREEVGGSGSNAIDSALVTEAILAAGGSTGVCAALFTHGIALPHIAANGSDALIERYVALHD